jgi:uncharacterized lipoprotein YajG
MSTNNFIEGENVKRARWLGGLLAWTMLAACAGKGEVIPLQLAAPAESRPASGSDQGPAVQVLPFEDARSDKRLGVRRHLWGGESYFELADAKPGDRVAEVVAEYFRKKGWRAETTKDTGGISSGIYSNGHDITLSGKLLDLSADADSKFMRTKISVNAKIAVQALNAADGSTVRDTLTVAGTDDVFWFEPEDVQRLLNDVVTESLQQLGAATKLENKTLRLK